MRSGEGGRLWWWWGRRRRPAQIETAVSKCFERASRRAHFFLFCFLTANNILYRGGGKWKGFADLLPETWKKKKNEMFSFSSWEIVTRTVKSKRKQFEYKKELPDRWVAELSKSLVVFQIKTRRATTTTTTLCVDVFAYTRGRFYLVSPAGLFFFSFYVGRRRKITEKYLFYTRGVFFSLSLFSFGYIGATISFVYWILYYLGLVGAREKCLLIPVSQFVYGLSILILYVFFVVGFSR